MAPSTVKCFPLKSKGAASQVPRTTSRNSSVRAYRSALPAVSPKRCCSTGSPPVTTFSISRPPEIRWYAAAICAARTGLMTPGRKATRNFSVVVSRSSAAVVSQASSQNVPVGVSTPSKPSFSAVRATSAR
jgi:hypothetical protein